LVARTNRSVGLPASQRLCALGAAEVCGLQRGRACRSLSICSGAKLRHLLTTERFRCGDVGRLRGFSLRLCQRCPCACWRWSRSAQRQATAASPIG